MFSFLREIFKVLWCKLGKAITVRNLRAAAKVTNKEMRNFV